ncbi:MAG TPA: SUMF1/EgtB/PvdO family nonheme iron enzyme [Candidatus Hydrogenedentes bacterium]|nr:SUMF1/EgtB/PvdO family nonheme iron enzyme [Candidatus Hydrogenedentota bacterium]
MKNSKLALTLFLFLGAGLSGCPPLESPQADFRANHTQGAAPLEVRFTDLSIPGKSPITEWFWMFGDGVTSTEQDPTHTYTAEGNFTVSLTVTTDQGEDTRLAFNFITVSTGGEGEEEGEFPVGEMISVPAGTFTMGRTDAGDDALLGQADELPRHSVTLSAYEIGKYDVTTQEYVEFLNWALGQGLLENELGMPYAGGIVFIDNEIIFSIFSGEAVEAGIVFGGETFSSAARIGMPGFTSYSMKLHPVINVSWYGAVHYCNWLSEQKGLTPCYDTETWTLNRSANGYHLPTEAQWEHAAAWDAVSEKHWIYGFMSDTNLGRERCNIREFLGWSGCVNPLGFLTEPYTSPVGWFNGINISPNGNIQTVDSPSPVGCYDMSGNVWQWCNDWYGLYISDPVSDPEGPDAGTQRVIRGGSWFYNDNSARSAQRSQIAPYATYFNFGFRLARF